MAATSTLTTSTVEFLKSARSPLKIKLSYMPLKNIVQNIKINFFILKFLSSCYNSIIKMLKKIHKLNKKITSYKRKKLKGKVLILFISAYFGILGAIMLTHNMWLSPDQFIIVGFVLALLVAQPIIFLRDWLPLVFLFLSYEFLRGLAPLLKIPAHIYPMINVDRLIFHSLPTVDLQRWLYTPGALHFYDYIATIFYMFHFMLPLIFGFFLWIYKRKEYYKFAVTLLVLSYLGFLTYLFFPDMPPWMASDQGIIPQVYNVFGATFATFVHSSHLPSVYNFFDPDPVAAMPSLHAAYPFLVYLFMVKIFGKKGHLFLIYVAILTFAIIYTGNHYVIDALFGYLYAYVSFVGVEYIWKKVAAKLAARKQKPAEAPAFAESEI